MGQSQILPYLTELSKKGFQFTILSFEKKGRLKKEKKIVESIVNKTNIMWVPLKFSARPPVFSKMYDRWQMKRTAYRLNKQKKFDMVHCRSYVAAEIGLSFKRKFETKFLFDMRGFWADEKVDSGQWNQRNPLYKLLYHRYKKKEKAFLLNADFIITLTQAAKKYLLSRPGYEHLSIEVIPCCADLDHFDFHKISTGQLTALRKDLKIPETSKVITYLGSAGGWYMIHEMFSFFKMLLDKYQQYVMLVLTKDDPEKIKEEASLAGIPGDKIIISYASRDKLPGLLALSSCSIFFIRNTFSKIASSPTKHAELMGMGIPVICNDIGDTGDIVDRTKTGFMLKDFSKNSFREVIDKINELDAINKEYIRDCSKKEFDLRSGVDKYLKLYNQLLN